MQLTAGKPSVNVGTVTLPTDDIMLGEAIVVAEAPQVTISEDTIGYNASAYRTPEGAMLEELVKKLPGAEVDEDGNIKINGKEVKKIMVDGKEFFGGDVKTGLKNLPVDMVDKLKTYDKKSDLARITVLMMVKRNGTGLDCQEGNEPGLVWKCRFGRRYRRPLYGTCYDKPFL